MKVKDKVETVKVETEKFCFTAVRIKDKAFFNFLPIIQLLFIADFENFLQLLIFIFSRDTFSKILFSYQIVKGNFSIISFFLNTP